MTHFSNKLLSGHSRYKLLFLSTLLLALSACTTKTATVYFPPEPAAPRVQLLMSFNNEGSLRTNEALDFIIGTDYTDQISKAYGLEFHQGKLYVADAGKVNPGLLVVDFVNGKTRRVTAGVIKPMAVDIDMDGTIYVADLAEGRAPAIKVLDNNLQYLKTLTLDVDDYRPVSILVVDDLLYVADVKNNLIRVLDKKTGKLLRNIGKEEKLGWPVDLSLTPDGNILVTETGAQRLQVFDPDGTKLLQIGSPGDRSGNFSRPKATAIDRDGHIYAVDVAFQNVQIFNSEGRVLMHFGSTRDQNTLIMPAGIAITYDNLEVFNQYVAPGFAIEYVIAVSSQGAPPNHGSKITLYGFGKKDGADYTLP